MPANNNGYLLVENSRHFLKRLELLKVVGFYFICIPWGGFNPNDPSSKTKATKLLHPRELKTRVVSDKNALAFSEHYLSQIAKYDQTYWYGHPDNTPGQIQLWPIEKVELSKRQKLEKMMDKYGFKSRLSFFNWVHNHDNWHAGIFLHSNLSENELIDRIEDNKEFLIDELTVTVDYLYRKYLNVVNPINNYGVLSSQCVQVLSHLAIGLQTEKISEIMNISEAGVNYHIGKARKVLGGENRTHLISLALKYGVI